MTDQEQLVDEEKNASAVSSRNGGQSAHLGLFAVFYEGETRPVAGFVLEQDAERYAKEYSGGAAYEIKHVDVVEPLNQTYLEATEGLCAECRKWLVWADNLSGNKHYLASKMRQEIGIRLATPK